MADEGGIAAPPTNEPGYLINDSKVGGDGKMFIGGKILSAFQLDSKVPKN